MGICTSYEYCISCKHSCILNLYLLPTFFILALGKHSVSLSQTATNFKWYWGEMEKHKLSPNLVALYLSTFKKNTYKQMFHNDGSCSIFYQRALSLCYWYNIRLQRTIIFLSSRGQSLFTFINVIAACYLLGIRKHHTKLRFPQNFQSQSKTFIYFLTTK